MNLDSQYIPKISLIETEKKIEFGDYTRDMEHNEGHALLSFIMPKEERIMRKGRVWVLLVDESNYCFGYSEIPMLDSAKGKPNIKEVMQTALLSNATSIITWQQKSTNENAQLSGLEIKFYQSLYQAGEILGVKIGSCQYYTGDIIREFKN